MEALATAPDWIQAESPCVKREWENIVDNLHKAGWSFGLDLSFRS